MSWLDDGPPGAVLSRIGAALGSAVLRGRRSAAAQQTRAATVTGPSAVPRNGAAHRWGGEVRAPGRAGQLSLTTDWDPLTVCHLFWIQRTEIISKFETRVHFKVWEHSSFLKQSSFQSLEPTSFQVWNRIHFKFWNRVHIKVWNRVYFKVWYRVQFIDWDQVHFKDWNRVNFKVWYRVHFIDWDQIHFKGWNRSSFQSSERSSCHCLRRVHFKVWFIVIYFAL